ncbi:CHAD domain-containing protein [Zafaria cholistanensis]|uniref:CHAD domain-containing protein n=1 Tax=Zafaria cholistanensis TaxID=1682741 RepID=A0A5A7NSF4_9MICC|nr:CYTH and CHAD domain-containing protein [Zafaria cholistanensis]GER23669.1 CHAD domain-containing protein [Zafaria cholistanensis]
MDAHTHLEVERKYDVGGPVSVPNLATVPGVARAVGFPPVELRADYFDTGGGTLGERKIILRRRLGGPDEGWHIKSAAVGGRMETHFPLGGQEAHVPEAVLDAVRVHTRSDPLRPVARVRTRRTVVRLLDGTGALLAEFCDDEVQARAVGGAELVWREWEVELGPAGTADLLDGIEAVLLRAGATPSTHLSKLGRVLDAAGPGPHPEAAARSGPGETGAGRPDPDEPDPDQPGPDQSGPGGPGTAEPSAAAVLTAAFRAGLETLRRWDPLVRGDAADAVHQMRIAARTLRSLLHTYGDLFAPEALGRLEDGLRRLGRALAGARDAEVVRDMVDPRCQAVPEGIPAAVRKQLWAGKNAERRDQMARLDRRLGGARYLALLNDLDAFAAAPPLLLAAAGPASQVLETRVERGLAEVLALAGRAAAADGHGERTDLLHEVRKTAKRLRYAVKAVAVDNVGPGGVDGEAGGTRTAGFTLGPGPSARMHLAADVQDALGRHRDSVMFQKYVRDSARQARKAGHDTFALGVLYGAELAVQDQAVREAEAALERLRGA